MPILIGLVIIIFSHFYEDKDFPENVRSVAMAVYLVIAILYIIFGLAF